MHTISILTCPNASIPGAIAVARGEYKDDSWTQTLRSLELRQVEWTHTPARGVLPRVSDALHALADTVGPAPLKGDPREGDKSVRLVICDNHWASVRPACERAHIQPDGIVSISAGAASPARHFGNQSAGRLFLLDQLRDRLPLVSIHLPDQPLPDHPNIVCAHDLRSALREVQARPRLRDEETLAPGLDREDILVLTVALAVDDLARHAPTSNSGVSINLPAGRRGMRTARRGNSGTSLGYRRR